MHVYARDMGPIEPFRPVVDMDDRITDQVVRRQEFEAAHPDWRIMWDADYRVFRAWRLLDGGEDNLTRYELRDLLDALEKRC